jgi:hypothetical protein
MYPWLWFWAPQVHLPWSGDVAQRIDPTTHWFFQGIRPGSGHARIEEQAFDVASYGKQLGLISELLLDLTEPGQDALPPKAAEARRELQRIADEIEAIKQREYRLDAQGLERQLREAQRRGGADFDRLAARLRPLLEP